MSRPSDRLDLSSGESPDPSSGRHRESEPGGTGPGVALAPLHAILDDPVAFGQRVAELRQRNPEFPEPDRPLASLLDAIVWLFKLPTETTSLETTAKARRSMADVADEERELADLELDRARHSLADFMAGLRLARTVPPGTELTLDARDPEQDRVAGALIAYLVATDFATVRTEELADEAYRYHLAVDWPRLDHLATRLGLPAPSQHA